MHVSVKQVDPSNAPLACVVGFAEIPPTEISRLYTSYSGLSPKPDPHIHFIRTPRPINTQ